MTATTKRIHSKSSTGPDLGHTGARSYKSSPGPVADSTLGVVRAGWEGQRGQGCEGVGSSGVHTHTHSHKGSQSQPDEKSTGRLVVASAQRKWCVDHRAACRWQSWWSFHQQKQGGSGALAAMAHGWLEHSFVFEKTNVSPISESQCPWGASGRHTSPRLTTETV